MFDVCSKKFSKYQLLNFVQDIFCFVKKPIHHTTKRLIHHLRKHKHFALSYVHIFLLLTCFYFYHVTSFNIADELPLDQQPAIVIENEPQIISDQPQEEVVMT